MTIQQHYRQDGRLNLIYEKNELGLHGKCTFFRNDGTVVVSHWCNGVIHGITTTKKPSGEMISFTCHIYGKLVCKKKYKNGDLCFEQRLKTSGEVIYTDRYDGPFVLIDPF